MPHYFVTSSSKGTGRDGLLNYIADVNLQVNDL